MVRSNSFTDDVPAPFKALQILREGGWSSRINKIEGAIGPQGQPFAQRVRRLPLRYFLDTKSYGLACSNAPNGM